MSTTIGRLRVILPNKELIAAGGVLVVMLGVFWWHLAQVKSAHDVGYEKATLEITAKLNEAHDKARREWEAERDRLQNADQVRVETVYRDRIKTETKIEYITKEIPIIDTSGCSALPADWVRLYNKAVSANCGDSEIAAHCALTESGVPSIDEDA